MRGWRRRIRTVFRRRSTVSADKRVGARPFRFSGLFGSETDAFRTFVENRRKTKLKAFKNVRVRRRLIPFTRRLWEILPVERDEWKGDDQLSGLSVRTRTCWDFGRNVWKHAFGFFGRFFRGSRAPFQTHEFCG